MVIASFPTGARIAEIDGYLSPARIAGATAGGADLRVGGGDDGVELDERLSRHAGQLRAEGY